jgi:hypothetical protein
MLAHKEKLQVSPTLTNIFVPVEGFPFFEEAAVENSDLLFLGIGP